MACSRLTTPLDYPCCAPLLFCLDPSEHDGVDGVAGDDGLEHLEAVPLVEGHVFWTGGIEDHSLALLIRQFLERVHDCR
jgi:hypothetical protein